MLSRGLGVPVSVERTKQANGKWLVRKVDEYGVKCGEDFTSRSKSMAMLAEAEMRNELKASRKAAAR